jgi:hypothetical protein
MIEHDPYEAVFGYSNRLLKGVRSDWPLDHHKWWQQEMNFTVRSPLVGHKVEINETDGPKKKSEVNESKPKATEVEPEPELEYDPISNRMIRKDGDTFRGYRQAFKITINTSSTPPKPIETTAPKAQDDQAANIPVKPYRPKVEAHDLSVASTRLPSFIMLKEDLPSERPEKEKPAPASSVRAEYEQYKAKRLEGAARSGQWLAEEGFKDHGKPVASSIYDWRAEMTKQFDNLHSKDQELAERELVGKRAWAVQRSKGTRVTPPSPIPPTRKEKVPLYDEFQADKEIHEYTMQVASDNMKNERLAKETQTKADLASPHKPLLHPSFDAVANREIRDYALRVAGDNIKNKRHADRAIEHQKTQEWLAEQRRKDFEAFNKDTLRMAEDRKLADGRRRSMEECAREEINHARSTIRDAKTELAELQARRINTLETSLQRFKDNGAVTTSQPLKTSLQRLDKEPVSALERPQPPSAVSIEQARTHDPAGYNHDRESRRAQQLSDSPRKFKIPSLAEMFGYNKKPKDQNYKPVGAYEADDASSAYLQSEVEAQKAAFIQFEASRNTDDAVAKISDLCRTAAKPTIPQRVAKGLEQKRKDDALVREIRSIYEEKYGPITTSHSQLAETSAAAEKTVEAKTAPEAVPPPPPPPPPRAAKLPEELSSTEPTPIVEKEALVQEPSSTLTAPKAARTAKYTILAYDSKSKNMTTASFESIPAASETAIPGTIVLRHLDYAHKFLPKLIELQHRGFVPVHAERNLLILRQDTAKVAADTIPVATERSDDPVKNETMAEESAVGSGAKEPRRLEPVFSGSHKNHEKVWRRWKEAKRQARHARRRRFRRAVKFVAGGVVLSGAVIYLAGVGAEVRQNRGRGKVVVSDDRRKWYDHSNEELGPRGKR